MSDGRKTRAGSSKSLTGSLSKILMGSSGKKSSKKSSKGSSKGSSRGKKYMGFTMTQILIGAAVVGGIYYYKEGFDTGHNPGERTVDNVEIEKGLVKKDMNLHSTTPNPGERTVDNVEIETGLVKKDMNLHSTTPTPQ
tara:strand:- start:486 stop:899 length:414 start_codon:yes stop_codon:yes gene_type:complete